MATTQIFTGHVLFSKPYHPNDGHGPGKTLPTELHQYFLALDGTAAKLEDVLGRASQLWPEAVFVAAGDYIRAEVRPGPEKFPVSRWACIWYEPV